MELRVLVDGQSRVVCGVTVETTAHDVIIALAHAMQRTGRFVLLLERGNFDSCSLAPSEKVFDVLAAAQTSLSNGRQLPQPQLILKALPPRFGDFSSATSPPQSPLVQHRPVQSAKHVSATAAVRQSSQSSRRPYFVDACTPVPESGTLPHKMLVANGGARGDSPCRTAVLNAMTRSDKNAQNKENDAKRPPPPSYSQLMERRWGGPDTLKQVVPNQSIMLNEQQQRLAQFEKELSDLNSPGFLENKHAVLCKENINLQLELQSLHQCVEVVQAEFAQVRKTILETDEKIDEKRKEAAKLNVELEKAKLKTTAVVRERNASGDGDAELETLETALKREENEEVELKRQVEEVQRAIDEVEKSISDRRLKLSALVSQLSEKQLEISESRSESAKLENLGFSETLNPNSTCDEPQRPGVWV